MRSSNEESFGSSDFELMSPGSLVRKAVRMFDSVPEIIFSMGSENSSYDIKSAAESVRLAIENENDHLESSIMQIQDSIENLMAPSKVSSPASALRSGSAENSQVEKGRLSKSPSYPIPEEPQHAMSFRVPKNCTKCSNRMDSAALVQPGAYRHRNKPIIPICTNCKELLHKERKLEASRTSYNNTPSQNIISKPKYSNIPNSASTSSENIVSIVTDDNSSFGRSMEPVTKKQSESKKNDGHVSSTKSKFRSKLQSACDEKHFVDDL